MKVSALPWSVVGEQRKFSFEQWLDAAAEIELDGIEFMDNWFRGPNLTEAARDAVRASGLPTCCVTMHGPVCRPDGQGLDEQVSVVEYYMGLAKQLDCAIVRVIGTTGSMEPAPDPPAAREVFLSAMERLLPQAEDLDLRIAIENHHGGILTVSDDFVWLFERCDHPRLGVNFDFKKALEGGQPPEDFVACPQVRDRLFYCHLDNFATTPAGPQRSVPVNQGDLDIEALLRSVKATGYDGWLSIEYGGKEQTFAHVATSVQWLRQTWPSL